MTFLCAARSFYFAAGVGWLPVGAKVTSLLVSLAYGFWFTIYSLLVFFWAEMYHFSRVRALPRLRALKMPHIVVNVAFYAILTTLFVVASCARDPIVKNRAAGMLKVCFRWN